MKEYRAVVELRTYESTPLLFHVRKWTWKIESRIKRAVARPPADWKLEIIRHACSEKLARLRACAWLKDIEHQEALNEIHRMLVEQSRSTFTSEDC